MAGDCGEVLPATIKFMIYDLNHLRFTIYDLRFRNLASLRLAEMRSVSEGGGWIMGDDWFERGWVMRSCVTG